MESEEIIKLVDGVYKNILEKFNPGARQLITAGKGYLKALHGAASASRMFNEALAKIAMNAQQSGTGDIGSALLNVVSVYKEIQDHQMNILKAFYVDLLVPLETNLEKDTKVVQHEQKKFMQQHKVRMEGYHKAVTTMKKQRKKKNSSENTEKELKSLQILEDQKKKLDVFCEQSYKHAMTQERRRYGFVLERQCSIAKHWMSYHNTGKTIIENSLDNWQEVAASREIITTLAYESSFSKRLERIKEDESHTGSSMLKKARSVDAPYGDMRTLNENTYSQSSLPRAKSDFNLTSSPRNENYDQRPVVKALYAYMPSGENQLPFAENDKIALVGKKAKGWQFGENLRTQMFGWFPIAYTNAEAVEKKTDRDNNYENVHFERTGGMRSYQEYLSESLFCPSIESESKYHRRNNSNEETSPTRMFGDTIMFRNQRKYRGISGANPRPGPPPTLPAPVPSGSNPSRMINTSQSFCSSNGPPIVERRKHKNHHGPPSALVNNQQRQPREGVTKTSLHSSNDSGFANEPPPQPEVDYSDEEHSSRVPIRSRKIDDGMKLVHEVASWTLSKNFRNSVDDRSLNSSRNMTATEKQSISFDNIVASDDEILQGSRGIKRTKSFWKFGRSDDILAGMSLWKHRDLVPSTVMEPTINEKDQYQNDNNGTLTKTKSNHSASSNEKRRNESVSSIEIFKDEENIYGVSTQPQPNSKNNIQQMHAMYQPKSRMKIMKTIEIDIDNPSEGERMNTLKLGNKERSRESMQQTTLKKSAGVSNHHQKQIKSSSSEIGSKKSSTDGAKQQATQKNRQPKLKAEEFTNTSEDDEKESDDDDDNGTLKMSDVNNFFDDNSPEGGVLMKTVKRQDILKQYYTSEDESADAEIRSTSSDPYDCIVINDHLVRRDDKRRRQIHDLYQSTNDPQEQTMEFQTFRSVPITAEKKSFNSNSNNNSTKKHNQTNDDPLLSELDRCNSNLPRGSSNTISITTPTATILPRTRLIKSNNTTSSTIERSHKNRENRVISSGAVAALSDGVGISRTDREKQFAKSYGPWYDFWEKQDQQTISNHKSSLSTMPKSKMMLK